MTKKITSFGQQILDAILDVVSEDIAMGFIGWEIGKTKDITAYVARKLGRSNKSVDGGLAHLIDQGYFSNQLQSDNDWMPVKGKLSVPHEGWLAYTSWDAGKVIADMGEESTLDDWLEWDGVDGMPYPYSYPLPDWSR